MTRGKMDAALGAGGPMSTEYRRGATDEAAAIVKGMSEDAREVYDYVRTVAQMGDSADSIVDQIARIFTTGWSLRRRLTLAWRLVTNR